MSFDNTIAFINNSDLDKGNKDYALTAITSRPLEENIGLEKFEFWVETIFYAFRAPYFLNVKIKLLEELCDILQKHSNLELKIKKLASLFNEFNRTGYLKPPSLPKLRFFYRFSNLINIIENNEDSKGELRYSLEELANKIQEPEAELLIKKLLLNKNIEDFNKNLKILEGINNLYLKAVLKKHADKIEVRKKYSYAIALFVAAESFEQNSVQEFSKCVIFVLSIAKSKFESGQLIKDLIAILQRCSDFGLKIKKMGFLVKELSATVSEDAADLAVFGALINSFEEPSVLAASIKSQKTKLIQNILATKQAVIFFEKLNLLKITDNPYVKSNLKRLYQDAIAIAKKELNAKLVSTATSTTTANSKEAFPADTKKYSDLDRAIQAVKLAAKSLNTDSEQEFNKCLIHVLAILKLNNSEQQKLINELVDIIKKCLEPNFKFRKLGFLEQNVNDVQLDPEVRNLSVFGLLINYYFLFFDAKD